MSFNMYKPSVKGEDITPRREPETNEVLDSILMRGVKKDILFLYAPFSLFL